MQVPLLSGILANEQADFVQSLPVNLEPISQKNGIANGYLRTAAGATSVSTGPGVNRGGILYANVLYRVMGTKLVSVDANGTITTLADVGGTGTVSFAYGFGRLAIRSGTALYYWDGTTLTQVTDPDLGPVVDVAWLNGQYFTTDGNYVIATDISDPTAVNPLRYGSAESDPDMVVGLLPLRNEMYVFGANTIEVQTYTGGSNFPLTANPGGTIQKGCVGPLAKCRYSQTFAFCGSGRGETPGIYLADGGSALKLSTRAVDDLLASVGDLSSVELEARNSRDEERLYVHLPDLTLVYMFDASRQAQTQVWYIASSGRTLGTYRPRHAVLAYNKFWVGDTQSATLGVMDETTGSHFGDPVNWQFDTTVLWNKGKGVIIHEMELVGLYGRGNANPASVSVAYTKDGQTYSTPRIARQPARGDRMSRLTWSPHTRFRNYLGMRFQGDSNALVGITSLNIPDDGLEALAA